jgi:hypothetical protein
MTEKRKVIFMNNKENNAPSRYPAEIPGAENKPLKHGEVVDVVINEIYTPHSQNPLEVGDNDSINTEFAKEALRRQSKESNA